MPTRNPRRANINRKAIPANLNPEGTVCYQVHVPNDPEWIALFSGAIYELGKQIIYDRDENHSAKIVAARWREVWEQYISDAKTGVPCGVEPPEVPFEEGCNQYEPNDPRLQYAPNDPFQTPDYTPPGYVLPPWYTDPPVPIPGVLPEDAMVNFLAIPSSSLNWNLFTVGWPRVRLQFSGAGTIETEFVKIPNGGIALVIQDGNPFTAAIVDLNTISVGELIQKVPPLTDLIDVVLENALALTEVHETEYETSGNHTLDITYLPIVDDDVLIGMGGGIRRVSVCTDDQIGDVPMPQFEFDGCELKWRPHTGTPFVSLGNMGIQTVSVVGVDYYDQPTAVYTQSDCNLQLGIPQGIPGEQGETGPPGPPGPQGEKGDQGDDCDCIPEQPPSTETDTGDYAYSPICAIAYGLEEKMSASFEEIMAYGQSFIFYNGWRMAVGAVVELEKWEWHDHYLMWVLYDIYAQDIDPALLLSNHQSRVAQQPTRDLLRNLIYCFNLTLDSNGLTEAAKLAFKAQLEGLEDGDKFWLAMGAFWHMLASTQVLYAEMVVQAVAEYWSEDCSSLSCSSVPCPGCGQFTYSTIYLEMNEVYRGELSTDGGDQIILFDDDNTIEIGLKNRLCLHTTFIANPYGGSPGSILCKLFLDGVEIGYPTTHNGQQSWHIEPDDLEVSTIKLVCDTANHRVKFWQLQHCYEP